MTDKPRLTLDPEASGELEALLDDIHGKDRPTVGNGTYSEAAMRWESSEDGDEAQLFPEHQDGATLHVTTDGQVWLNPTLAGFDGLCIGAGDNPVEDAVKTLERALELLYALPKRGA